MKLSEIGGEEVSSKYVQTLIDHETFSQLKLIAVEEEKSLTTLLKEAIRLLIQQKGETPCQKKQPPQ
jgi:hypothetical protein